MTTRTAARQASLSFTIFQSLLTLISTESVMPLNHLILCHPLFLLSIFPSIRVFFPMSWLFALRGQSIGASAPVLPMNLSLGITTLISLLSKGLPRVFFQHHNLKASALLKRWPRDWSFNFSISPSNDYSGLISFRIDWFDLLAVQGTLKSLLQHHNLKASVLLHSASFMVPLSHLNMTTGKTIALTRQTFVGKVMSLLFSMRSRLVIAFLPRGYVF